MSNKDNSVQSIQRAFQVLEVLRLEARPIGVSEMAKILGLTTTTAYRLLSTLKGCRAVQQDPQTHLYYLNDFLLLYGKAVLSRYDFLSSAHPVLGELSKNVGETVFMGILDDCFDLIYIDQVDSLDHPLRMTPQIGLRQPSHSTSLGKVLLADLPDEKLNLFLSKCSFTKITKFTISTDQELRKEMDKIREVGYALDQEETEIGICCVAAPIRNSRGTVAAISISGPSSRMRSKGLDNILSKEIVATASELSQLIQSMDLRG